MRWEYMVIRNFTHIIGIAVIRELNKLGDEGWELVGLAPDGDTAFFKRPAH